MHCLEKELLLVQLYGAVYENRRKDTHGEALRAERAGHMDHAEGIHKTKWIALGRAQALADFVAAAYEYRGEGEWLNCKEFNEAVEKITQMAEQDARRRDCQPRDPKDLKHYIRALDLEDD